MLQLTYQHITFNVIGQAVDASFEHFKCFSRFFFHKNHVRINEFSTLQYYLIAQWSIWYSIELGYKKIVSRKIIPANNTDFFRAIIVRTFHPNVSNQVQDFRQ